MNTALTPSGLPARPFDASSDRLRVRALLPFLLITFAIAWGILGLYMAWPAWMSERFGQLSGNHPFFYLAVYAPAIGGFVVVLAATGVRGLARLLSRTLWWRCTWGWYLFLGLGIPAVFFAGALIKTGTIAISMPEAGAWGLLTASALMLIKGPVEEFGWRGVALPLLQRRMAPFWAGLLLGMIWGLWHLPAFLLSGTPQSDWSFAAFFAGSVALSVIITPIFNRSGGSILLPVIFHFQLINPAWPDAQPYDTYILIAIAAGIVWFSRGTMFHRAGAVTQVVPAVRSSPRIPRPD